MVVEHNPALAGGNQSVQLLFLPWDSNFYCSATMPNKRRRVCYAEPAAWPDAKLLQEPHGAEEGEFGRRPNAFAQFAWPNNSRLVGMYLSCVTVKTVTRPL